MKKIKPAVLLLAIGAFTAGGSGYLFGREQHPADASPPAAPATQAAVTSLLKLRLATADGQWQNLAEWRGKVLVVNYWATWCPPCRAEMPGFSRLHDKYKANGVQFVGIAIDSVDKVREFRTSQKISYPLLIGTLDTMLGSAALGNSVQALPFTVIIDRNGALDTVKLGLYPETELETRLRTLIAR